MVVAELLTKLGFTLDRSSVESAQASIDGVRDRAQNLGMSLGGVAKAAIAAVTAYAGFSQIQSIVQTTMQVEDLTTSFEVMLGSADKAKTMIADLRKFGAETPYEFTDLAQATKTLLQFGVSSDKVMPAFKTLGDIAMGDKQRMQSLALVYGQVQQAGRLQGGDLMQLVNAGFNPLNEIAKKTGESMEALRDRMSRGKVSAKEMQAAFASATAKGGQFYQGMEKGSKTLSGLWSTFNDGIASVRLAIGEKLLPSLKEAVIAMNGVIDSIIPKIQAFADEYLPPIVNSIRDMFFAVKEEVINSGVIGAVSAMFEAIAGKTGDTSASVSGLTSAIRTLVRAVSYTIRWIADIIKYIAEFNTATDGAVLKVAALAVELVAVYKVIAMLSGAQTMITGLFAAMTAAGTEAGAAGGIRALTASFGPLTIAIMAAVAAYQALDYWDKKLDDARAERINNANKASVKTMREAPIEQAKSELKREESLMKELQAIDRKHKSSASLSQAEINKDMARVKQIENEWGLSEGDLTHNTQFGGRLHLAESRGGKYVWKFFNANQKALQDRMKKEAEDKKKEKDKAPTITQTNDVKVTVPEGTARKGAKKIADHVATAVQSEFSLTLKSLKLTTI